jgi:hypothetical protein
MSTSVVVTVSINVCLFIKQGSNAPWNILEKISSWNFLKYPEIFSFVSYPGKLLKSVFELMTTNFIPCFFLFQHGCCRHIFDCCASLFVLENPCSVDTPGNHFHWCVTHVDKCVKMLNTLTHFFGLPKLKF